MVVPDTTNRQTHPKQSQTDTISKPIQHRMQLSPKLAHLLQQAWEIRTANFPMEITCIAPTKTRALSVTGINCALNCAHCGRHYLKGMESLETALGKADRREQGTWMPKSYLISGGYTSQGKVPLFPYINDLQQLKETSRINVHPGLVNKEEARALAAVADVASFDFVANRDIIRQVYGLDKQVSDYINSYRYLVECFGADRVVPHVTIGLAKGRVTNEAEAVQILAAEGISRLVLLVFRPTPGTLFEKIEPPAVEDVAAIMAQIRTIIPRVPVYLGCMRPGGVYRNKLDLIAVQCGLNKIVQPARSIPAAAKQQGLEIIYEEECCSL